MAIKYISVYRVTRHYGGPEEGGWWYDWYELLETLPFEEKPESEELIRKYLNDKYKDESYGDINSVLGGAEVEVVVEDTPGANRSTEVPHYE